jgi:hypothetical protein
MAIIEVNQVRCLSGGEDSQGNRTASVLYQVITDSISDGMKTILASEDLPQRNDHYTFQDEEDTQLFLSNREAVLREPDKSRCLWNVTCTFTSRPTGGDSDKEENNGNPLDMRPKMSTYTSKDRKAILSDLDGQVIASSAGEPYDPVQEIDNTRVYFRIVRNVLESNAEWNTRWKDKVNSDAWGGFPAGSLKVETPGTVSVLYMGDGTPYYEETWEFAIAEFDEENQVYKDWKIRLYDYGMYQIVDGERFNLVDQDGEWLTSAAFLDGAGVVLGIGDPPVELPAFRVYESRSFAVLNLPERI